MTTAPAFAELFGREPAVRADAPGRVNLIGEHTDYNGGFVLPTPSRSARASSSRRARATDGCAPGAPSVRTPEVRGVPARRREAPARRLARLRAGRHRRRCGRRASRCGGFDLRIASDVPLGGGLSSSAALEVVAAARAARGVRAGARRRARSRCSAQRAENDFVGAPVGVMDQMAAQPGRRADARCSSTRAACTYERIPLPAEAELVVIDSGRHAQPRRRRLPDAARASASAAARAAGRPRSCATSTPRTSRASPRLPEPLDRRARHVVTENARVAAAVAALRERRPAAPGRAVRTPRTTRCATTSRSRSRRSTALVELAQRGAGRLRRAADRRRLRRLDRRRRPPGAPAARRESGSPLATPRTGSGKGPSWCPAPPDAIFSGLTGPSDPGVSWKGKDEPWRKRSGNPAKRPGPTRSGSASSSSRTTSAAPAELLAEALEKGDHGEDLSGWQRVLAPAKVLKVGGELDFDRTPEMNWIQRNWQEYRGQWVALLGGELLAHSSSLDEVMSHLDRHPPARRSLLHYIAE